MKRNVATSRTSARRLTWMVLAAVACLAAGSYGYHLFRLYQQWQRDTPQPQVERLVRELRRYQQLTGSFPADFHEINAKLWQMRPQPYYGADGREARVRHYEYRYARVAAGECVLWALPIGAQRQTAQAYFVVIAAEWARMWQGAALAEAPLARLPAIPTPRDLQDLQMREVAPTLVKKGG